MDLSGRNMSLAASLWALASMQRLQALSLPAAAHCPPRSLANLGALADKEAWGVEPFEEKRDTHLFTRR